MGIWERLCTPSTLQSSKSTSEKQDTAPVLNIGTKLKDKMAEMFSSGLADALNVFFCDYCFQVHKFTMSKTYFVYNLEKASNMENSKLRKYLYK
jgi:hypothetical protein